MDILKKYFERLDTTQKIIAVIMGFIGLILAYCLTAVIITFIYLPDIEANSKIKYVFKLIPNLYRYFSLKTPLLALFNGAMVITVVSFVFSILLLSGLTALSAYLAHKRKERDNLHGNAKWSNLKELEANNLSVSNDNGILVGLYQKKPLYFTGAEFVSLGAPTRSGKGTGIVIPNLVSFKGSMVVLDIKKECFDYTSKYRKDILGQDVYMFNPFSFNTHCYNPLTYLDFNSNNVDMDIKAIANVLYVSSGGDDFFVNEGKSAFIAITYLLGVLKLNFRLAQNYTLSSVLMALNGVTVFNEESKKETLELELVVEIANNLGWLPQTIYNLFVSFFKQRESEKQFAAVKTSYENPLKPFSNQVMEYSTSKTDFDFRELRKKPMTIYLVINPENLSSARPILNLFFSQLIFENIKQGLPDQNPDIKNNILMLMDEFTSIGFMEQYQLSVSYMAGYWLRSLIIYQNDAQLEENKPLGYGKLGASTLIENHACNIIYRPKDVGTAEKLSKRIGTTTTKQHNKSTSNKDLITANVSRSENITGRALILPQEIMALKGNEELILCNSVRLRCEKANYFSTPILIEKFKQVSETLKNAGTQPSQKDYAKAVQNGELAIDLPVYKENQQGILF